MPHQQARDYSTAKPYTSCDAASCTYCNAPCCIRTSATREERKPISVMKLTAGVAARSLPDDQHLASPQVSGQVGVVLPEAGHGRVIGLGDAAESLPGLDLVKGRSLGGCLGTRLGGLGCLSRFACLGRRSEEHTSELQSLRHLVCR